MPSTIQEGAEKLVLKSAGTPSTSERNQPELEANDGELEDIAGCRAPSAEQKKLPDPRSGSFILVAGTGFEPVTFRL
jgi:hypothetical protein